MGTWRGWFFLFAAVVVFSPATLAQSDTEPPVLVDFDFNPKSVDVTTGEAWVTCTMAYTDPWPGVGGAVCDFTSPNRRHHASCSASAPSSGDIYDGVWTCQAKINQWVEGGAWYVDNTRAGDVYGNLRQYETDELSALGHSTELGVGFTPGRPRAIITIPDAGKHVRGSSLTVKARLASGDPNELSPSLGVIFDYRALPFGDIAPIPARNPNQPNPDTSYPYFIHWDVSQMPNGDYELRAVAHDLDGTPDPAPETITITIDHAGPADVEEFVNSEGRQENQTAMDSAAENKIASGDRTEASTATELTLPPGSLLYTTDAATLIYPDPADEESQLEQVEQSIGAFVNLSLLSGQTDLEAGMAGDLNISFADANQDGVVDGTSIREEDLDLRYLDPGTSSYVVMPSIVLTEHNMVHAEPTFLGKFALAGPLMPRMRIDTDKQTLTWEAVSTATSYVVYRGLLSALVDTDVDGLPDSDYGDCMNHLDIDPTDLLFVDPDDPLEGDGFFYLVGFVGPSGAAGLGNTSSGLRRMPAVQCP